jgi:hypothetical protein
MPPKRLTRTNGEVTLMELRGGPRGTVILFIYSPVQACEVPGLREPTDKANEIVALVCHR